MAAATISSSLLHRQEDDSGFRLLSLIGRILHQLVMAGRSEVKSATWVCPTCVAKA